MQPPTPVAPPGENEAPPPYVPPPSYDASEALHDAALAPRAESLEERLPPYTSSPLSPPNSIKFRSGQANRTRHHHSFTRRVHTPPSKFYSQAWRSHSTAGCSDTAAGRSCTTAGCLGPTAQGVDETELEEGGEVGWQLGQSVSQHLAAGRHTNVSRVEG